MRKELVLVDIKEFILHVVKLIVISIFLHKSLHSFLILRLVDIDCSPIKGNLKYCLHLSLSILSLSVFLYLLLI